MVFNNNAKELVLYRTIHKHQLQPQTVIKIIADKTNAFPSILAQPTSRCSSTILSPSLRLSPLLFSCWNFSWLMGVTVNTAPNKLQYDSELHHSSIHQLGW